MPLCRYGGVLSVQIESKIRAVVQEGAKNSTQIWDMRACSFSHVGRVTYLARGFWNAAHSYERKTEVEMFNEWKVFCFSPFSGATFNWPTPATGRMQWMQIIAHHANFVADQQWNGGDVKKRTTKIACCFHSMGLSPRKAGSWCGWGGTSLKRGGGGGARHVPVLASGSDVKSSQTLHLQVFLFLFPWTRRENGIRHIFGCWLIMTNQQLLLLKCQMRAWSGVASHLMGPGTLCYRPNLINKWVCLAWIQWNVDVIVTVQLFCCPPLASSP